LSNVFNPAKFVKTAKETYDDKLAFDKFISENSHLAQPFHVDGLEKLVPPQFPGELAMYVGKPHHGKSTALRDVAFKAQRRIEGTDGFIVGMVSLEDTSEATAAKQARRYGDKPLEYQDDQFIFVGNSFNMTVADMASLNVTNIISALDYGRGQFAANMNYSFIAIDYAQLIPPDPERRMMTSQDQKRLQVADDVKRIFHMAKYFKCPIGLASQALIKQQRDSYTSKMRIPGAADLKEASELFEVPDIVYSYWQPKHEHPIGSRIEEDGWNFVVEADLCFVRIVKRRNAELLGFVGKTDIIGRVFPCRIRDDGSFFYSKEGHRNIYLPMLYGNQ
jgi:hypothetical protein